MKKSEIIWFLCGAFVAFMMVSGCAAHSNHATENPEATLRKAFPNLPFESITKTDINGLFEVVSGQNIFYYYPEKEYLLFGEIYTTAGKSLTAERKGEIAAVLMKNLPLEKAVKTGNGKTVIIEFTDPDCPYCRKAYDFLKTRTDVTIYSFFSPFAHPAAIAKVYYILNAEDKAKAYQDIFEGKNPQDPAEGYSETIKRLAQEHLDLARSVGVSGTPTFFIGGKQVIGADIQRMESLIDGENQADKAKLKQPIEAK